MSLAPGIQAGLIAMFALPVATLKPFLSAAAELYPVQETSRFPMKETKVPRLPPKTMSPPAAFTPATVACLKAVVARATYEGFPSTPLKDWVQSPIA